MKQGKKVVARHWVFIAKPNETQGSRLGITITKKVGCAVVRNRLKRRLREYFRTGGHGIPGLDIVVIGRNSAARADFEETKKSFESGLLKLENWQTEKERNEPHSR
jgi:ribonuclease P protein component